MPSYISLHRFCNRRYKTSAEEFDRSAYCFANSTCASDITWSGFNRNEVITPHAQLLEVLDAVEAVAREAVVEERQHGREFHDIKRL